VFAVVSEQVHRTGDFVEFQIATRRDQISDRFSDEEFTMLAEEHGIEALTALYSFYGEFIKKGTRETYRKLWHRSITDECDSLRDLAPHADDVVRTYEFLEEEAIETNFEDLSDAIQDAHTFTADVTSTVSERTTGLTSEIQKVVLTLLGAVFANVFLVIRWSNVDMVLPFSIFVIAGILGFYFPTIQTRVNELDDIIQESDADFEVYSQTIQEFSDHLFDFSRFEDRRDSYLQYAQRRKSWTIDKLRIIFTLLTLVWLGFAVVSIIGFAVLSRQFIVAVLSLLPAVLIVYYHNDLEYYPTTFVPFLERGPSPMTVLVGGTLSALVLKFLL
jgi:ABC-type multidrug transport system fused ATPase/permease subunit